MAAIPTSGKTNLNFFIFPVFLLPKVNALGYKWHTKNDYF